ncbi:hypothetical protein GLYMA_13G159651v4 [Glycine max]|nr:hypothetical protein GLYMA_13G159651v4 [Glycine max]KAH1101783.1 hypothetical protein GYH30_036386 [Glycine max]
MAFCLLILYFFLEGRKINVVVYIFLMSEAKQERVSCHAV